MTASKENRAIGFVANKLIWPISGGIEEKIPMAGIMVFALESGFNVYSIVEGFKLGALMVSNLAPEHMSTLGPVVAGVMALAPMAAKAGILAISDGIQKRAKAKYIKAK